MLQLSEIQQVQVELTTRCNARCPMCMRNYRGLDYNSGYPITELTLSQFKQILKPNFLKQLSKGISFNGNLGDFGLAKDSIEIVNYLVEHKVLVSINTNGSMRTSEWWASLAQPGVEIGFALDGLSDTHSLYRQDTSWQKIIDNASAFIQAGGHAIWRFIPFDHNRHQEQDCIKLAQDLGFARFENIHDGRNQGPVFTRSGNFSHWLGSKQDFEPDIQQMVNSHVTWFDHRTVKPVNDTPVLNIVCQHKRQQEIYIAADGTIWPCCFLGFYPGQMTHPGNEQLLPLVQENNALQYDLEHCVKWFGAVEQTWSRASVNDGRLYPCVNSCNRV
jgi:sulfatase maturation enzyme AslB (radical SAM superfamily)